MQWPSHVQETLEELASCLCAQVEADGLPAVCFCGVVPGLEIALDYQGDCADACGMAWVRLVALYPSTSIGQPSEQPGNCSLMLGLDIEIGMVRCASGMDEAGTPPTAGQLLADTELQVADALAMRKALLCCHNSKDFLLGPYAPYGPAGGMVGGAWTVALQVS